MTRVKMTKSEALEYCWEHRNEFIRDSESVDEGIRQFDCLISLLEYGTISPDEIGDYGMEGFEDMPKKKIVVIPSIVESCGKIAINAWKKSKVDNPSSRKAAIRANCLQCFGGSPKDVANCESKDCVFHQFRITG